MPKWIDDKRDAEDLKPGWRAQMPKGYNRARYYTISKVDVKVKFVYVTCEEAIEPFRIERHVRLNIQRSVPTEQETADKLRASTAAEFRRRMEFADEDWDEAQEEFKKHLDERRSVTGHDFMALSKEQARYELSCSLMRHGMYLLGIEGHDWRTGAPVGLSEKLSDDQMIELLREWYGEALEKILRDNGRVHNEFYSAIDLTEKEVLREWVSNLKFRLEMIAEQDIKAAKEAVQNG